MVMNVREPFVHSRFHWFLFKCCQRNQTFSKEKLQTLHEQWLGLFCIMLEILYSAVQYMT